MTKPLVDRFRRVSTLPPAVTDDLLPARVQAAGSTTGIRVTPTARMSTGACPERYPNNNGLTVGSGRGSHLGVDTRPVVITSARADCDQARQPQTSAIQ